MDYLNIEFLKKGLYFLKKPFFGENNDVDLENNTENDTENEKQMDYYRKSSGFKDANDSFKEWTGCTS